MELDIQDVLKNNLSVESDVKKALKSKNKETITTAIKDVPVEKNVLEDNIPVINVSDISSKFLPYPKNCQISYKVYTYGETLTFTQSKLNRKQLIDFILTGVDTNFDKYDLTFADMMQLAALRKLSTYGSDKYTLKYVCVNCEQENSVEFLLTDLNFEYIKAPKLPVKINIKNECLEFMPLTVKDYLFLIDKKLEEDNIALLAKQCKSKDFDDVYKLLKNATYEQGKQFELVDSYLVHGLEDYKHKCKECSFDNSLNVNGGDVLIQPFRKPQFDVGNGILFGNEA